MLKELLVTETFVINYGTLLNLHSPTSLKIFNQQKVELKI